MPAFRYPQFCAIARAAELVGERWTILVLRELFFGPRRFADLRRGLSDVSPSVLSARLGSLEAAGIIEKSELPAPAASVVYQLTERGRAFGPVLMELGRWGAAFLLPARPGEQLDPDRLPIILSMYARRQAVAALRCELRLLGARAEQAGSAAAEVAVSLLIEGGASGTRVTCPAPAAAPPAHVTVTATAMDAICLVAGTLDADEAAAHGRVRIEGDARKLALVAKLFDLAVEEPAHGAETTAPSNPQGE